MPLNPIGDLAASLAFLRHSTGLKHSIERLTNELASGTVADVHARLGGNYAYLADIDSSQAKLRGYSTATAEAASTASAMQASLAQLHAISTDLAHSLTVANPSVASPVEGLGALQAREDLEAMMATLNTSMAGRALFSGTAYDTAPLADTDTLLDGLRAALAGLTDAGDIRTAATDWFGPGGGFETTVYLGSTTDASPVQLDDTRQVALGLRADDEIFRGLLRETALAAVAGDALLALSPETSNALQHSAGIALLAINDEFVQTRGDLGFQEARIEETSARIAASQLSLEHTRSQLLAADPYETAARLEDAQFRLEAMFMVAARSASLKLVNFL